MQLELGELDLRYVSLRIIDRSRQRQLVASLLEHGQLTPALVVRDSERWVLLDGYVRVAALAELARDLVDVAVLEVSEAEALVLAHGLDNGRERTALEEGWLLRELCDRHGLAQTELGQGLVGRAELADRMDELARLLAWRSPQQLAVADGRAVAASQRGLLVGEHVDRIVEAIEHATVPGEHANDAFVGPAGDFGDFLGRRPG